MKRKILWFFAGVKDGRGVVRPVISINIDNLVEGIVNGKIDLTKISGRKFTRL